MGLSTISLGLGLGGGKSATSSGRPAGGGAFSNLLSASFDGSDDFLNCGSVTAFNNQTNLSYSLWYKTSQTGKVGLLGGGSGSSVYHWTGNTMYVHAFNGSNGIHSLTIPTLGAWHNVILSYEGGATSKLYVDGIFKSSQSASSSTDSNTGTNFAIGKVPGIGGLFANALIDEVVYFPSALTDGGGLSAGDTAGGNVETIYNGGVPGDISSLNPVTHWRMGDGEGDVNSGGGDPANGGTIGTVVNQGSFNTGSGEGNGTGSNGPPFSTDVPA
mgnify:CR=1 FL=1